MTISWKIQCIDRLTNRREQLYFKRKDIHTANLYTFFFYYSPPPPSPPGHSNTPLPLCFVPNTNVFYISAGLALGHISVDKREASKFLISSHRSKVVRGLRSAYNIVEECCDESCVYEEILEYC